MWSIGYFKRRSEAEAANLLQQKNDTMELVRKAESKMLSKPCKLSPDGPTCSNACAHFEKGRVWLFEGDVILPAKWIDDMPRCKLWRE